MESSRTLPETARAKWAAGARPKTLPAAAVPVLVGTAVAGGHINPWRAVAAAVVALALQVGVNYANDYSDGVRGTDGPTREGPPRLVGDGLAAPASVKRAAFVSFAVAALAGLALAAAVGPELVAVGVASIAAAWFYTGGPRPYGYAGLGELFVFVFFGLVATVGSAYVHTEQVTALAVAAALPVGAVTTALLVVNNLRDRPGDAQVGKRTLAVRIGDGPTRALYLTLLLVAAVGIVIVALDRPWALLGLIGLATIGPAALVVGRGAQGRPLIPVLEATGRSLLLMGVLMAAGIALS
ncbi:MAG: 1,4-dihydroxy-2-naphthoate polyprenyltransferase [Actinomycetia bacterium]|nr:1,4-dihydroxy-2-naphthoate polyprenyltransferase [Actinomycetes bacterium]